MTTLQHNRPGLLANDIMQTHSESWQREQYATDYVTSNPPPPYSESIEQYQPFPERELRPGPSNQRTSAQSIPLDALSGQQLPAQSTNGLPLPVVIPQIRKTMKGAFYSPFVRAYAPALANCGISQTDFLTFLDGLNECWVANPAFTSLNLAGMIMQQAYGVQIVQLVGLGVSVASGFASAGTSYTRTRLYFKAMNREVFHPAGLHATIATTKDMMGKVGHSETELKLPDLDSMDIPDSGTLASTDSATPMDSADPRMRRLQALSGYVSPLDFDMPDVVDPDNILKRMGNAQAKRMTKKQDKKAIKKSEKFDKTQAKIEKEERKKDREHDKEMRKMEKDLNKEKAKMEKDMAKATRKGDEKEQRKIAREFEKEEAKLQKEMSKEVGRKEAKIERRIAKKEKRLEKRESKEQKQANKIRWIVISNWEGEEDGSSNSEDSETVEEELQRLEIEDERKGSV